MKEVYFEKESNFTKFLRTPFLQNTSVLLQNTAASVFLVNSQKLSFFLENLGRFLKMGLDILPLTYYTPVMDSLSDI